MILASVVVPKTVPRRIVDKTTRKVTVAFSNSPGPIKPFFFDDNKGNLIKCLSQVSYIIPSGFVGMGIVFLSSQDGLKLSVVVDNIILKEKENERFV